MCKSVLLLLCSHCFSHKISIIMSISPLFVGNESWNTYATSRMLIPGRETSVHRIPTEEYRGLLPWSIANKTFSQYCLHIWHMYDRFVELGRTLACPITPQQPGHKWLSEKEALMSPRGRAVLLRSAWLAIWPIDSFQFFYHSPYWWSTGIKSLCGACLITMPFHSSRGQW